MGSQVDYKSFLRDLDKKLFAYFEKHNDHIVCKPGCSACCEKGDYPLSELELRYLMKGYAGLDNETKIQVQQNIKSIKQGGACPFLINSLCSIYEYRPIICRVHGLAYLCKDKTVKLPYCVNNGLNYKTVYKEGLFLTEPIKECLDTVNILKEFDCGEIRNLFDWLQ